MRFMLSLIASVALIPLLTVTAAPIEVRDIESLPDYKAYVYKYGPSGE